MLASLSNPAPSIDDAAPTVLSVEKVEEVIVSVEKVEEEIVSVEKVVKVEKVFSSDDAAAKSKPTSPTAPLLGGHVSPVSVCGRSSPVQGGRPVVVGSADHDYEHHASKTLNTAALGRARSWSSPDRSSSAAAQRV